MNEQKKKTSRQLQAERTSKKLLEVSYQLMIKYGYDKMTIQMICREAGVSTGAFYHYMKGKSDIIVKGYAQCDAYFEQEVTPLFEGKAGLEYILEYIGYQFQYAVNMGAELMIMVYRAQLTDGTEFFLSPERGLVKGLIKQVEAAQSVKALPSTQSASEIARQLLALSRGLIYDWCLHKGAYPLKEKGCEILKQYIMGFK